ncbi:MAG: hypothetical protein LBS08_04620 [Candidatus Symbiothrix sp.]|jgi:hypothetical protein|nr:hypothetical protein [Candidatus Symbiothrix sp.]
MKVIVIYSPEGGAKRLNYVSQHIFGNILGETFKITTSKEVFLQETGVCVNYSRENLNHGLQIIPQGLLFETGVCKISDLEESKWKDFFCFFKQQGGSIPFDLFSAAFYLLTSYEEYYIKQTDEHDRFDVNMSLLYRNDSLEIPLIDRWAYGLKEELEKKYPDFKCKLRKYSFISTFDIDYPFMYRYKGIIKTIGLTIRDMLKSNFNSLWERLGVIFHLKPDPYMQTIQKIDNLHKKAGRDYYLFVLLGRNGKYGRSTVKPTVSYNKYLKSLKQVTIGSHPSYDTYHNPELLTQEKEELEKITNREITTNRRHFLRMTCPQSFREAVNAGFKEDFTLGFAKAPGFRSGTAIPYYFYDVEQDIQSDLLIRPTIMMDTTLIVHLDCNPGYALLKIKQLADECKRSGGDFLTLWHNSNIAGEKNKLWNDAFIASFNYAVSLENDNFAK